MIELLVASAIGLVIVAALSQLFVDITRSNQEMAKTNSQIENARLAMQLLEQDIMHAGFWNTHVPEWDDLSNVLDPNDVPAAIPDPCLAYSTANWTKQHRDQLVGVPLQVTSGAPGTCGGLIVDQVAGTDVLVVRHAHTCEPGTTNCDDPGTVGQLYFQPSVCENDAVTFAIDPNSILPDRTCAGGTDAPRRKFEQSIYYIRDWYSDTPAKDGIPTLVRSSFELSGGALAQQAAQPLVPGIEQLRIEVGIDSLSEPYTGFPAGTPADPNEAVDWLDEDNWETATNRGDGIPDGAFVHCPTSGCNVGDLMGVVAVRLHVLARASESTAGYEDDKTYNLGSSGTITPVDKDYKRHAFSTTVRLENISARRETP